MPIQHPLDGLKSAVVEYDFAKDGGAISTITLRPLGQHGGEIPQDAIIFGGVLYVQTAVVGSGASCALQSEGAGDLVATAAVSGAPWSTTGQKAIIPVGAATSVRCTVARSLKLVISAAVLTAGKFRLYVQYM